MGGNKKILRDNAHISDEEIITDITNLRRDIRFLNKIVMDKGRPEEERIDAQIKTKASFELMKFCERLLELRHPQPKRFTKGPNR